MAAGGLVITLLFDFAIILLVAKLFGEVAERLRQPAVLGELFGGLIIGPGMLALIPATLGAGLSLDPSALLSAGAVTTIAEHHARVEVLGFLAELGAIILLFEVGLETNLQSIVKVGKSATFVAVIGIVGSVVLGYGVSWALGAFAWLPNWSTDPIFHLFVGATFAATSVGITARVLKDMGRLNSTESRIILGAAILDDVGGLLVLAVVAGIVSTGSFEPVPLLLVALKAFGFLLVAVLVGVKIVPPLFARIAALRVRGVIISSAFLIALALAAGAAVVGLAPIVGAFAAGMVLAHTKEHHSILSGVAPLGHVFVPFFFVIMGTAINLRAVGENALEILTVFGLLLVVAVFAKLLCGLGVQKGEASRMIVGVGMVPRGEVGLIFVGFGIANLNVPDWEAAALILTVMATTILVPPWLRVLYKSRPLDTSPLGSEVGGKARVGDRHH